MLADMLRRAFFVGEGGVYLIPDLCVDGGGRRGEVEVTQVSGLEEQKLDLSSEANEGNKWC